MCVIFPSTCVFVHSHALVCVSGVSVAVCISNLAVFTLSPLCECVWVHVCVSAHSQMSLRVFQCLCVHIFRPLCVSVCSLLLSSHLCVCVWIMCPVGGCFLCVCSVSLDKVGDISALEQRDTTQQHLTNSLSLSLSLFLCNSSLLRLPQLPRNFVWLKPDANSHRNEPESHTEIKVVWRWASSQCQAKVGCKHARRVSL